MAPADPPAALNPSPSNSSDPILFDQYSRYASLARVLRALAPEGSRVLDVGSGPYRLLGGELPGYAVHYHDPLLTGEQDANTSTPDKGLPSGASFDYTVCVDTLEHIPAEERAGALRQWAAWGPSGLVISCPWMEDPEASRVDRAVDEAYKRFRGRSYPWLVEHTEFGLPSLESTRAILEGLDLHVQVAAGNGHGPWLRELLGATVCLLDDPSDLDLVQGWSAFFNEHLAPLDHLEPVYRRVLVATPQAVTSLPSVDGKDPELRRAAQAKYAELRGRMIEDLAVRLAKTRDASKEQGLREQRLNEALRDLQRTAQDNAELVELGRTQIQLLEGSQRELREQIETLQGQLEQRDLQLQERAEDIARLEGELQTAQDGFAHWHAQTLALQSSPGWQSYQRIYSRRNKVLRPLRRVTELTLKAPYHLLPLQEEQRWKAKSWVFGRFGKLLRNTRSFESFQQERAFREQRQTASAHAHPAPAPPRADKDDVFVFAVIDWHFRIQRPQHMARELAKAGHRVFYLSPSFHAIPEPGFLLERLDPELELYSVCLQAVPQPVIYSGPPAEDGLRVLTASLQELLRWCTPTRSLALLQHPGWIDLARCLPGARWVYDCMDHHAGFAESGDLEACEADLMHRADLTVVSSQFLHDLAQADCTEPAMVRNACDFEHFTEAPLDTWRDPLGRQVVGYYGAIAEWFDVELFGHAARHLPEVCFLLVGADSAGVAEKLGSLENVTSLGEVSYAELPRYLHGMDVTTIPFQVCELTLATNPVKVYEYLAAGKPVVATPLPELQQPGLQEHVTLTEDKDAFVDALREALASTSEAAQAPRRDYAAKQTWQHRGAALLDSLDDVKLPKVSVIVLCWNGIELSRRCIEAALADASYPDFELVVVDNGSTDGTLDWLREVAQREERVVLVENGENLGFAAGNNRGLKVAKGEYLVLLNNDTVPSPGWLRTLIGHLRNDPEIGLLGPVTNNIGNEARVPSGYETDMEGMRVEARQRSAQHAGQSFDIPCVAFFCVAMPRATYEKVGGLDEGYGLGFFEDDDYCRRVEILGKRIVCAEDVFVHHELSASFDAIGKARRDAAFAAGKQRYEEKWGEWIPHSYRGQPASAPRTPGSSPTTEEVSS